MAGARRARSAVVEHNLNGMSHGTFYTSKTVRPIFVEDTTEIVVITVASIVASAAQLPL